MAWKLIEGAHRPAVPETAVPTPHGWIDSITGEILHAGSVAVEWVEEVIEEVLGLDDDEDNTKVPEVQVTQPATTEAPVTPSEPVVEAAPEVEQKAEVVVDSGEYVAPVTQEATAPVVEEQTSAPEAPKEEEVHAVESEVVETKTEEPVAAVTEDVKVETQEEQSSPVTPNEEVKVEEEHSQPEHSEEDLKSEVDHEEKKDSEDKKESLFKKVRNKVGL